MIYQSARSHAAAVDERGFTHSTLDEVLGAGYTAGPEWQRFAGSWNNLRLDTFMADGGTYRERRYSEFRYSSSAGAVLPHVPYSQPKDINYLNGGIDRSYEAFEPYVAEGPVLASVFRWCATALTGIRGAEEWKVQAFQNRILARGAEQGRPTPEGRHRDGVDFVLTLLAGRESVSGGTSGMFEADGLERVANVRLATPGEFLFADDLRMLHSVTPITPEPVGGQGHRDVLIAMFTRLDG